jgi:hypothetical protein
LVGISGLIHLYMHLQDELRRVSCSIRVGSQYPILALDLSEAIWLRLTATMDIKSLFLTFSVYPRGQCQTRYARVVLEVFASRLFSEEDTASDLTGILHDGFILRVKLISKSAADPGLVIRAFSLVPLEEIPGKSENDRVVT